MNTTNRYVLITAARNEEAHIGATIQSVMHQTILPVRWIIVDDDSNDRTHDIIIEYAKNSSFIQPVHLEKSKKWGFKSKVNAIHFGYHHVNGLDYKFLGILDADITFDDHYYENILLKFSDVSIRRHVFPKLNANPYIDRKYFLDRKDRMRRQTPGIQTTLSFFAMPPRNG